MTGAEQPSLAARLRTAVDELDALVAEAPVQPLTNRATVGRRALSGAVARIAGLLPDPLARPDDEAAASLHVLALRLRDLVDEAGSTPLSAQVRIERDDIRGILAGMRECIDAPPAASGPDVAVDHHGPARGEAGAHEED